MYKIICCFLLLISIAFANEDSSANGNQKVLVENLKTLVFQDSYHEINVNEPVYIDNVFVPYKSKFIKDISEFLDKPVSIKSLSELKTFIIRYYRNHNYPLVGVSIPAGQDITDGKVYVIIQVAKIGKIEVEGAKYFVNDRIKKQIRLKPGETIKTSKVVEDLEWLNDNPFRNASVIYSASDKLSSTDVIFNIEDKLPYRFYAGYEYSSYTVAGPSRFLAGFNIGNLFNREQQLNFQFLSASNINDLWGIAGTYVLPLPWRNIIKLMGSFVRAISDEEEFKFIDGKGWTLSGRYEIPLPVIKDLSHDFILGIDFKRTNNFLQYAENLVFNKNIDIFQFLAKYQGSKEDRFGYTSFEGSCFYSPGNITEDNTTSRFELARPGAKAHYVYLELDIERIVRLKGDLSWVINFLGQYSFSKLMLSEQLAIGGASTVRGYMENEVSGDSGLFLRNEIRFPNFSFKVRNLKQNLQFLAFLDYGFVADVDKNILNRNSKSLLSVGPGVRYSLRTNISLRFDYGFQLIDVKNRAFETSKHSQAHLSLIGSF
jgi:hemolysin activation/secretion protein